MTPLEIIKKAKRDKIESINNNNNNGNIQNIKFECKNLRALATTMREARGGKCEIINIKIIFLLH